MKFQTSIVAVPMKTATVPENCNAIMDSFVGYFGTPIRIICDQDPAFMSHLTQWFLHTNMASMLLQLAPLTINL